MENLSIQSAKILLIEDNEPDVVLVRNKLNALGIGSHAITNVKSVAEAYKLLKQETFSLVLTDLSLPDSEDTETTLATLREHAPKTPIIILSGNLDENIKSLAKMFSVACVPKTVLEDTMSFRTSMSIATDSAQSLAEANAKIEEYKAKIEEYNAQVEAGIRNRAMTLSTVLVCSGLIASFIFQFYGKTLYFPDWFLPFALAPLGSGAISKVVMLMNKNGKGKKP